MDIPIADWSTYQFISPSWHVRFAAKIFNRPYRYELDCLEEKRLEKLREKCMRDESDFIKINQTPNALNEEADQSNTCGNKAPFWWNQEQTRPKEHTLLNLEDRNTTPLVSSQAEQENLRWQEEQNIVQITAFKDPCVRREELAL